MNNFNDFEKIYQVIKSSYTCGQVIYNYGKCEYDNLAQNYIQKGDAVISDTSGYKNVSLSDLPIACNIPSSVYNICSPISNTLLSDADDSKGFRLNINGYYLYPNINDTELIFKKVDNTFEKNNATFLLEKNNVNNKQNYYLKHAQTNKFINPYISNYYINIHSIQIVLTEIDFPQEVRIYNKNNILTYKILIDTTPSITTNTLNYLNIYMNSTNSFILTFMKDIDLLRIEIDKTYANLTFNNDTKIVHYTNRYLSSNDTQYIVNNGIRDYKLLLSDYYTNNILTESNPYFLLIQQNINKNIIYIRYQINNIIYQISMNDSFNIIFNSFNENDGKFILEKNNEIIQFYSSISNINNTVNYQFSSISKDNNNIVLYNKNNNFYRVSTNKGKNFNDFLLTFNISGLLISKDGKTIVLYDSKNIYFIKTNSPEPKNKKQLLTPFTESSSIKKILSSQDTSIIYIFTTDYKLYCIYNNILIKLLKDIKEDIAYWDISNSGKNIIYSTNEISPLIYVSYDYGNNIISIDLCKLDPNFSVIYSNEENRTYVQCINTSAMKLPDNKMPFFIDEINFYITFRMPFYILYGNINKLSKGVILDYINNNRVNKRIELLTKSTINKYIFSIEKYDSAIQLGFYKLGNFSNMIIDSNLEQSIIYNENINFNVNNDGSEIVLISGPNIHHINTNLVEKDDTIPIIINGLNFPSYNYNIQNNLISSIKNVFNVNTYTLTSSSDIVKNISNNIKITKTEIYINNTQIYKIPNSNYNIYFTDIACSYNGQSIIACIYNGKLIISNDSEIISLLLMI